MTIYEKIIMFVIICIVGLGIVAYWQNPELFEQDTVQGSDFIRRQIVAIDGCQYIKSGSNLTHKGDCSNPVHEE